MSAMGAKLVTGGILAVLGLVLLKFILGIFGVALFVLVKVVPLVIIGMIVVWLFRRLTRSNGNHVNDVTP